MLAVAFLTLLAVAALIGQVPNLGRLRLRGVYLVCSALIVQVVVLSVIDDVPVGVSRGLHIATYAMLVIFLFANRAVPYLWVIGVGTLANFVAIAANGGVMPASAAALRSAGRDVDGRLSSSDAVDDQHLGFLGDVFAIPERFPLANVFSVGDVVLLVGLVLVVITVCRLGPDAQARYLRPPEPPSRRCRRRTRKSWTTERARDLGSRMPGRRRIAPAGQRGRGVR